MTVVIAWLALGNSLPASAARDYDIPAMPGPDTRSISSGSAMSVAAGNRHARALASADNVKRWDLASTGGWATASPQFASAGVDVSDVTSCDSDSTRDFHREGT